MLHAHIDGAPNPMHLADQGNERIPEDPNTQWPAVSAATTENITTARNSRCVSASFWWVIVLTVVVAGSVNSMVLFTFAPIFKQSCTFFASSLEQTDNVRTRVNLMFSSFQIMFLPGTLAVRNVLKSWGLRNTLLYGGVLTTTGCLIRWAAAQAHVNKDPSGDRQGPETYALILMGTFVVAQAQAVYMNLPTVISLAWFDFGEMDFAMTILSLTSAIGSGLGMMIPTVFVKQDDIAPDALASAIAALLLFQFALAGCALVVSFFFFSSAPALPPSIAAARDRERHFRKLEGKKRRETQQRKQVEAPAPTPAAVVDDLRLSTLQYILDTGPKKDGDPSFWATVKTLLANFQYLQLVLGYGFAIGSLNCLGSLLGQLGTTNTPSQIGFIGVILGFSGMIGSASCGKILSKYKAYAPILKTSYGGAFLAWICFFLTAHNDGFTGMAVTACAVGFFTIATIPANIQCAVEATYPSSEDLTVGILMLANNLTTIPLTYVGQYLLNKDIDKDHFGVQYGDYQVVMTCILGIGAVSVLTFRGGNYKRTQVETQAKSSKAANDDTYL